MLPPPPEWRSVESEWPSIRHYLTQIDLDTYEPHKPLRVFAPKNRANIRVVHLLHPEDLILYTALVLIVKDDLEAARIPKRAKRVFSYRANRSAPNRIYDRRGAYDAYLAQLRRKADKSTTRFVAIADVADFYPRIYQHRLENVIESTATTARATDVARVLVRKLIAKLIGGNSYGIPVGPYASRLLGEAVLIDVDSYLQSRGIDFVRWVDDYNLFARSEYLAQSTVFDLGEWLYTNHGLTLQTAKTKILPVERYIGEVLSKPDDTLTDRDLVISLLRGAGDHDYDDDDDEEEQDDGGPDEEDVDDLMQRLQAYDLRSMFMDAISDESLVDYEMVRYVLRRLPGFPGAEELKSEILTLVLNSASLLYPAAEYMANFVIDLGEISKAEKAKVAAKLLKPLKSKRHTPPEYYAMWILHIFSTSADWNHVGDIVSLYQQSTSDVVKRYAALAIAVCGTRAEALVVKDELAGATSLLRLAILAASHKLGKDERKHWKLSHDIRGILEKFV